MTCSTATEEVKSIFEGATQDDILHYLADAKERGLTGKVHKHLFILFLHCPKVEHIA